MKIAPKDKNGQRTSPKPNKAAKTPPSHRQMAGFAVGNDALVIPHLTTDLSQPGLAPAIFRASSPGHVTPGYSPPARQSARTRRWGAHRKDRSPDRGTDP